MHKTEEEILVAALALPEQSRVNLIEKLSDSLSYSVVDDHLAEMECTWYEESLKRLEAYKRGEMEALPGEQVMAELRSQVQPDL